MTYRSPFVLALTAALATGALFLVACDSEPGETSCTDGIDNDMNGFTDCAEPVCIGTAACMGIDGGRTDGGRTDGGGSCGAASCGGCCDGDSCLSGVSLAACGMGGGACDVCLIGATCETTGCEGGPVACGPGNCATCCMGDICVPAGDTPAACGMGGGGCDVCESFEVCSATGCGVDPTSEWQISILDAVVPPTKVDGSDWDPPLAGECDPFVSLRVGSAGATAEDLPEVDGTLTPDWTEGGTTTVLSMRYTAAQLLAFLRFDMFDDDTFLGLADDLIGMCRYDEGETPFNGDIVTLVCPPTASNAGYTLRWQLVPG